MLNSGIMIVSNILLIVFSIYVFFQVIKNKCSIKFILFCVFILLLVIYNCVMSSVSILVPKEIIGNVMMEFSTNGKYANIMLILGFYEVSSRYIFEAMLIYIIYKLYKEMKMRIVEMRNKNK